MVKAASPQIVGRYAIFGKIAQGGMAAVHFGRLQGAAGFSRTVAVKRLHPHLAEEPEFIATLIDEARLAARIYHPNVVSTIDVVSEGGEVLVIMDYVRGESLYRLLLADAKRNCRAPLPIASAIVIDALHGLHAAHEATDDRGTMLGIVHRDVSPQNILVGVDGAARIIDFGVAKAAGRLQTTREGVIKGKVAYMAPEQMMGHDVTRRVDVYAMGVVLWELISGRRLLSGNPEVIIAAKAREDASEPPSRYAPNLPKEVDVLVATALARDPAARFATTTDMADQLARLVPPAQPGQVAAWVEELARDALSLRSAALAEIESASGITTLPAMGSGHGEQAETHGSAEDGAPSVATQPSESMGTPGPHGAPAKSSIRKQWWAAGAMLLLLVACVAALTRASTTPFSRAEPRTARETPAADGHEIPSSAVDAPSPSSLSAQPSPAQSPAASDAARSVNPPRAPSLRHAAAKPKTAPPPPANSSALRFAQPD